MSRPRRHEGAQSWLQLTPALPPEPTRDELDARLRDQSLVDQAVGMLMAYYGVSSAAAAAALHRWAEGASLPLVHMAAGVVEAGSQPSLHPFGSLRRVLRDHALDALDVDVPPMPEDAS